MFAKEMERVAAKEAVLLAVSARLASGAPPLPSKEKLHRSHKEQNRESFMHALVKGVTGGGARPLTITPPGRWMSYECSAPLALSAVNVFVAGRKDFFNASWITSEASLPLGLLTAVTSMQIKDTGGPAALSPGQGNQAAIAACITGFITPWITADDFLLVCRFRAQGPGGPEHWAGQQGCHHCTSGRSCWRWGGLNPTPRPTS